MPPPPSSTKGKRHQQTPWNGSQWLHSQGNRANRVGQIHGSFNLRRQSPHLYRSQWLEQGHEARASSYESHRKGHHHHTWRQGILKGGREKRILPNQTWWSLFTANNVQYASREVQVVQVFHLESSARSKFFSKIVDQMLQGIEGAAIMDDIRIAGSNTEHHDACAVLCQVIEGETSYNLKLNHQKSRLNQTTSRPIHWTPPHIGRIEARSTSGRKWPCTMITDPSNRFWRNHFWQHQCG